MERRSSLVCGNGLCTGKIYANSLFCSQCGNATTKAARDYLNRENERADAMQAAASVFLLGFTATSIVLMFLGVNFLARLLSSAKPHQALLIIALFAVIVVITPWAVWGYGFIIRKKRINEELPSLPTPQPPPAPPKLAFPCNRPEG